MRKEVIIILLMIGVIFCNNIFCAQEEFLDEYIKAVEMRDTKKMRELVRKNPADAISVIENCLFQYIACEVSGDLNKSSVFILMAEQIAEDINSVLGIEFYKNQVLTYKSWTKDEKLKKAKSDEILYEAEMLYRTGDYEQAMEKFQQSLKLAREINDKSGIATLLNNIGEIYYARGEYDKALRYYEEALAIGRELRDKSGIATRLNNIGGIYYARGEYDKALKNIQESLQVISIAKLIPTDKSKYPNPDKSQLLIPDYAREILDNKGYILYKKAEREQKNIKEKISTLKEAVDSYKLSIELTEEMRVKLAEEKARVSFVAGRLSAYEGMIRCLLRLAGLEEGKGWELEAFNYSERSKARVLVELLNESKAKKLAGIPEDLLRREKEYLLKIGKLESEIDKSYIEGNQEKAKNIQKELDRVRKEYESFIQNEIKTKYPKYASMLHPEPVDITQAQQLLDEKTAIIEYFVGSDFIAYWVITKNTVKCYQLNDAKELFTLIDNYIIALDLTKRRELSFAEKDYKTGLELYRNLIKPSEAELTGIERIIIVPDGILCRIPFQALVVNIENNKPRYLVENYSIVNAQSVTVLKEIKQEYAKKRHWQEKLFAMCNPAYGEVKVSKDKIEPKPEELEKVTQIVKRSAEIKFDENIKRIFFDPSAWQKLETTEKEVNEIVSILKANPKYVFKSTAASEDRLKKYSTLGKLKDFRYIHFACHGKAIDEPSALSCIVLTQDDDPAEDGFLTVGEVYGLELDSDLVTLSACELALGGMKKGEGVIGLTRAFICAGTPSVIASLWPVADVETAEFMIKFYEKLEKGMQKDKALQQAAVEQMKKYPDPFFWAPFVLYGAWY